MTSTQSSPDISRDDALRTIVSGATAAIADNPDNAQLRFQAEGQGAGGVRTEIRIGAHAVTIDEPPALGGQNAAPNPVEFALASLLSCQVVTYRYYAAQLGIPLDEVRVDVEGDLDLRGFLGIDAAVRPGYTEVRLVVDLRGPATAADYARLRETVDAHCPVLDLFRAPTPVTTRLATR